MKTQKIYTLGIDTGGTYTDAVILGAQNKSILASAKAITTKGDLSIGITEAMAGVLEKACVDGSSIGLVSISTTLATNAVVEGHGSPIGVVLIGFDSAMIAKTGLENAFPGLPVLQVAGGHNHNGEEVAELDIGRITGFCEEQGSKVSAFAVASSFAVRNASHETAARKRIVELTGKPVTVSTEITSSLDAPRRALTAALNARLISKITDLLRAVRRAANGLGLACPVMIVRGDGTLASGDLVAARPIETILSGPAASLVGARWLTGLNDFMMSDVGGTTTDIGLWTGGRPRLAAQGASVGGWRTMVQAIDVTTIGLGGDSEVHTGLNGKLDLGPSRALPVSLLASRRPEIVTMLRSDLAETEGGSLLGKFVVLPFGSIAGGSQAVSEREREILSYVTDGPVPLKKIAVSAAAQRAVQSLRRKGLLQYCTLTPSDVCHVLNKQSNWSREAAVIAAQLSTRFRTMKAPDDASVTAFCWEVWGKTVELSCRAVINAASGDQTLSGPIVDAVCKGAPRVGHAKVSVSPEIPLIAVGGPARVFYDEVGRRLECQVVFPEYCDVANAVGAAAGIIQCRAEVIVEGDGQGQFRVFAAGKTLTFASGKIAVEAAIGEAKQMVLMAARAEGALEPRVEHNITRSYLPDATDDEGLVTARIFAEASGVPAA